ncbi:hypothetical protein BS78_01G019700 [Paspalum vaginatum]|nr:hypothetical protein BS78_01G019700 [Paspalum vaginatum]
MLPCRGRRIIASRGGGGIIDGRRAVHHAGASWRVAIKPRRHRGPRLLTRPRVLLRPAGPACPSRSYCCLRCGSVRIHNDAKPGQVTR